MRLNPGMKQCVRFPALAKNSGTKMIVKDQNNARARGACDKLDRAMGNNLMVHET